MKEDRMLNDIELENVAAGEEVPKGRIDGVLASVRKGLEGIHEMLVGRFDGAYEVLVMIKCIETMQADFSTKSEQMEKIRKYFNSAMNSDMLEGLKGSVRGFYNILISEIGE